MDYKFGNQRSLLSEVKRILISQTENRPVYDRQIAELISTRVLNHWKRMNSPLRADHELKGVFRYLSTKPCFKELCKRKEIFKLMDVSILQIATETSDDETFDIICTNLTDMENVDPALAWKVVEIAFGRLNEERVQRCIQQFSSNFPEAEKRVIRAETVILVLENGHNLPEIMASLNPTIQASDAVSSLKNNNIARNSEHLATFLRYIDVRNYAFLNEAVRKCIDNWVFKPYLEINRDRIDPNLQDGNGDSALCHAVLWRDVSNLKTVLEIFGTQINPNLQNRKGETALIKLWKSNFFIEKLDILRTHCKEINPNLKDKDGNCVLSLAVVSNKSADLKALLESFRDSIDPNVQNNQGDTPLMRFCQSNVGKTEFEEILKLFKTYFKDKLDLSRQNCKGETVLFSCIRLSPNAIPVQFHGSGKPLQISEQLSTSKPVQVQSVKLEILVRHFGSYIDPNIQIPETLETFAMFAAKRNQGELILLFKTLKDKIDLNIQNKKGYTVLMFAVFNYSPDFIRELVSDPRIDLTMRNIYEQDIIDILNESTETDPRIKKLVEVAYQKQNKGLQDPVQTLEFHVHQIHKIIQTYDLSLETKSALKDRLDCFVEEVEHATHGRHHGTIGMSMVHRKTLQGRRVMLLEELQPTDSNLLDHLYEDEIVTLDQLEEIKACQTRRKCAEKLLSILPFCGEKAFDSFLNALRQSNKGYIADDLEKYDPEKKENTEDTFEQGVVVPALTSAHQSNVSGGLAIPIQLSPNRRVTLAVTLYNDSAP